MSSDLLILATAFAVCAVMGPFLIPFLHKIKFGQSIRGCGPESHQKKSGTPKKYPRKAGLPSKEPLH